MPEFTALFCWVFTSNNKINHYDEGHVAVPGALIKTLCAQKRKEQFTEFNPGRIAADVSFPVCGTPKLTVFYKSDLTNRIIQIPITNVTVRRGLSTPKYS